MVNQNNNNSIVSALFTRARELDAKLNEAYTIKQIFQTLESKNRFAEIYAQNLDAWTTYYRVLQKL